MAYVQCKIFIRNALKAPSTAEFPDYVYAKIKDFGDGEYLVGLYVDAENSLGAKIRQNFVCDVKYIGNDNWMLIDLK